VADLAGLASGAGQRPARPAGQQAAQQATVLEPFQMPPAPPPSSGSLPVIPPGPPVQRRGGLVSRLALGAVLLVVVCVVGAGAIALGSAALSAARGATPTTAGAATATQGAAEATATADAGPSATPRFSLGATVRPSDTEPPVTDTPTLTPGPRLILEDDFSDDSTGWEVGSDSTYSQGYGDGAYVIEILREGYYVWGIAGRSGIRDVRLLATARSVRGNGTFGVVCHHENSGAFYMLGVDAAGYYAIIRVDGQTQTYLTDSQNRWLKSSAVPVGADEYEIEAVCTSDGALTLSVGGLPVVTVQDDTYVSGDIGLFAYAVDQVPVEVRFDDVLAVEAE